MKRRKEQGCKRPSQKKKASASDRYLFLKERSRARNAALSATGRNIGEIPPPVDPERKDRAQKNFRCFCDSYFPQTFYLPWSADHQKVIAKIEESVLRGGLFAMAMPRGSGKTSLCECACIWAVLYGHRNFVCLIGASEAHALEMLAAIKKEFETNDLLSADFPEVCYPIQKLEGIANRCAGQLYRGERTHIVWTSRELVLPTIAGSAASGAVVRVAGITGRIRGMKFRRPDGKTVRPSLVVLDDPQTDESARSLSQCETRERILAGAVLGLAGPGKKIAGIMPCTVICANDMADRILDRAKHPEWQGERMKMVYSFPQDETLWSQYAEIRAESLRRERGIAEATEFYRQHREEMDAGAVVAWPERYNHDELSAVQHAMNLKLQDERAFWAEYQNEPLPETPPQESEVSEETIVHKLNRMSRGLVPIGCQILTMFIDVQANILFYTVVAWEQDFTGYVIDYGTFPEQRRAHFTARDARPTLQQSAKGAGLEGAIYAGLEAIVNRCLEREWPREDGAKMRIERCLIDANWGQSTDVIYQFCRQSAFAAQLLPSHGRFVGASSRPLNDYQKKPGDRIGLNWRMPNVQGKRAVRYLIFDTNFWKSFVHARLATAMGDRGCLSFWGNDPERHRLFAEHLTAEQCIKTEGRGRIVNEWRMRVPPRDNHWFDCLVGCAVAASIHGAGLPGMEATAEPKRPVRRMTAAELVALARRR